MVLKKNDFVELEFTGYLQNSGEVFDSNIKEDLEKAGHQKPDKQAKPFIYPLGNEMFLKSVDDFLIGKEVGEYNLDLEAKDAFGKRNPQLVQLVSKNLFIKHNVNPIVGATFNMDGRIARVLSVNGGRVMVDFNNPIAGKDVKYKLKVKRKVEETNEKIQAFNDFIFRMPMEFEIKDKKVIYRVPEAIKGIVESFDKKIKELFNLDLEVHSKKDKEKKE